MLSAELTNTVESRECYPTQPQQSAKSYKFADYEKLSSQLSFHMLKSHDEGCVDVVML